MITGAISVIIVNENKNRNKNCLTQFTEMGM